MALRFRDEETFPGTKEQITTACFTALKECRFKVTESNDAQGWIRARAPMSFRSLGETIILRVHTSGTTEVFSESRFLTQISDGGKNRANVNKLLSKLRSALRS